MQGGRGRAAGTGIRRKEKLTERKIRKGEREWVRRLKGRSRRLMRIEGGKWGVYRRGRGEG